ncbi:hypothetical protein BHF71_04230 [Vulcanibacillus modesticaldus]|uniref:Ribosomal RNA small subunit methyltransferase E n=1 Tax=Vulcanibacillus modesticaldus TaxID=337097 RepID=A0A1D2YSA3_9BACI|nr:16S rRNA (uracil(1498)-N(3))-methyltransferase [Vulcanibacillus modesticaldus]OEF96943.1 hypothetical protein BHF71_04230 [Vulcanibacillus modesticaldus]
MQRYFVSHDQFKEDEVIITGDDAYHLSKVLRAKPGEKIICSNGQGFDAITEIISINLEQAVCKIVSILDESREPTVEITLAQGLPKSDKMDLIVQKGTEIGISSFLPFISERTIVQLNQKKEQKRIERWKRIAKEAAEQSHRSKIPEILPVISFKELLTYMKDYYTLIAFEQEDTVTLYQALNQWDDNKKILLIIGPEGGFSEQEVSKAIRHGAISITLGKRILRTETAGIVGSSNIIYHLEQVTNK